MTDDGVAADHDGRQPAVDEVVDGVLEASRALVAVSARSIGGAPGVTLAQYRMLVVLGDTPRNLRQLADSLDVVPSTALRMVDRLVAAGLVERSAVPGNRRESRLSLTARGRRTVRTVTGRRRRDLLAVVDRIDPARRGELVGAMTAFAEAAEQVWPGIAAEHPSPVG